MEIIRTGEHKDEFKVLLDAPIRHTMQLCLCSFIEYVFSTVFNGDSLKLIEFSDHVYLPDKDVTVCIRRMSEWIIDDKRPQQWFVMVDDIWIEVGLIVSLWDKNNLELSYFVVHTHHRNLNDVISLLSRLTEAISVKNDGNAKKFIDRDNMKML